MLFNVPQPIGHIVETFHIGDVVHKHDAHGLPENTRSAGKARQYIDVN